MADLVQVSTLAQVLVTEVSQQVIEVQVPGPQGPAGEVAGGLPTGGDPGSILIKDSYANYDSSWSAVVDGGTFN
jgi:hypothetical protein